jgi:hypothetical protein
MSAIDHGQLDDMVAGLERGDVGSDLFDDAGRLMPQDARVGSLWQTPVALILTSTSWLFGRSISTSSIDSLRGPCRTAAFMN